MMTENACRFISPLTFETLTNSKCMTDTFDRMFEFDVKHISAAKKADVLLIAPATANVIAKLAYGIADDMLTTPALACRCPKIVAPAMNTNMYLNPVVQNNLKKLAEYGWTVVPPDSGRLACGDSGTGKMPSEKTLLSYIPVSYTHLDVYKRQIIATASIFIPDLLEPTLIEEHILDVRDSASGIEFISSLSPALKPFWTSAE